MSDQKPKVDVKFTDTPKEPSYLDVAVGKFVKLKREDKSVFEIEISDIAHSLKYPDRAVLNGTFFIDYFDLFGQIYGNQGITEADWEKLKTEFNVLPEEQRREILGYANEKESKWTQLKKRFLR